ncbi:ankyrin repeat domain-containing protein [Corynebacterium sp. A21]|uniref:ankyrin repeat domain-containing protein n=1 Tax=Corynebacterium sp. A21 TaxID=3457318 RepID=UPI003FCF46F6
MPKYLRKTLPKNFREIVESGDMVAFAAVFEKSSINAYVAHSKEPALATFGITTEQIRWLLDHGADLQALDSYENTPLHHHAGSWKGHPGLLIELGADLEAREYMGQTPLFDAMTHPVQLRVLLAAGAEIEARDAMGDTPLRLALRHCRNSDLVETAESAALLIDAGATVTEEMRSAVREIAETFEHGRADFNPDSVVAADAALARLYQLFQVEPLGPRRTHQGAERITVQATGWREPFTELWHYLVPASGAAATVQGEVIRILACLNDEIGGNGGVNWDHDFQQMVAALPEYLSRAGQAPGLAELALIHGMHGGQAEIEQINELAHLCTTWVLANPEPLALETPAYRR